MDLSKGREFRDELQQEIKAVESRLSALKEALAGLNSIIDGVRNGSAPGREKAIRHVPRHMPTRTPPLAGYEQAVSRTRYDRIDAVLEDAGKRLSVGDITDGLLAMGDGAGMDRRAFYKTVDSALRAGEESGRYKREHDTTDGKNYWLLEAQ